MAKAILRLSKKSYNIQVIPNQSSIHFGMIATGNHWYYRFAARSTTGVGIPWLEGKSIENHSKNFGDCHASVRTGSQ